MLEVSMFLDEDDQYQGIRTDEYIMRHLMHHGIRGASVFPAMMGYGPKQHLHHTKRFGNVDEGPIMFIDEEENVMGSSPASRR